MRDIQHAPRPCSDCDEDFTPPPYQGMESMRICEGCAYSSEFDDDEAI